MKTASNNTKGRRTPSLLGVVLLLVAFGLLIHGGYTQLKLRLAQAVLDRAWETSPATRVSHPGLWAGHWPKVRLYAGPLGASETVSLILLEGLDDLKGPVVALGADGQSDSAESVADRGLWGSKGSDTHERFLETLDPGDEVAMQDAGGRWWRYVVELIRVVDVRTQLIDPFSEGDENRLLMVTSYPFDAEHAGGPLRYVVTARRKDGGAVTSFAPAGSEGGVG